MYKHRMLKNLIVIGMLAGILCAGIFIPFELLEIQKQKVFEHFTMYNYNENKVTAPSVFTYDELVECIVLWDLAESNEQQAQLNNVPCQENGLTGKETGENDLTMLEAQLKGSEELKLLMNMGILPQIDLGNFSITSASLFSVESDSDISRWELYFSDHSMVDGEGTEVMISIDSVQGCIYTLSIKFPKEYNTESTLTQLAKGFALYHNISGTKTVKDGCIQTADGLLRIQAAIEGKTYNLKITSTK